MKSVLQNVNEYTFFHNFKLFNLALSLKIFDFADFPHSFIVDTLIFKYYTTIFMSNTNILLYYYYTSRIALTQSVPY